VQKEVTVKELFYSNKNQLATALWETNPWMKSLLASSSSVHDAREKLFEYLNDLERTFFNVFSELPFKKLHIIDRQNAKESIKVFKNILRTENELLTSFSPVKSLWKLALDENEALEDVSEGFLLEMIFLSHGINGRSGDFAYRKDGQGDDDTNETTLDKFAGHMREATMKFKNGAHPLRKLNSETLKKKILDHFGGTASDWEDHSWHMKHLIRDIETLSALVNLEEDELKGLETARATGIDFQITPYYLSLFNETGRDGDDQVLRAQVLPGFRYCLNVYDGRQANIDLDFMGEKQTQPVDGITRRYPQIVILKVVDSCPQICVYCQRNWELKPIDRSEVNKGKIDAAIDWISKNNNISEVLITGGDPLLLNDNQLDSILKHLSVISHVERIRIGTRVFATLPFRVTNELVGILEKYHQPGRREICLVTHFEHTAEITDNSISAVTRVRKAGMSIYNQQVFTFYNSRRYESVALRKMLKLCGIDPYYTFNTKGKNETVDFRVPLARIQQERKEEARFTPGLVRTDEPVFNVPKMGKSHLRSWQDHEVIMIKGTGERVYRFLPWQSRVARVDDYLFTDVSIYDYLNRLHSGGEDVDQYSSIWFYY